MVRAGIEAVAKATNEDPEELLKAATDGTRRDVIGKEQAAERMKQDLQRMKSGAPAAERKEPREGSLLRGHLSRQLYKTLHELEALQVRRLGGAAPLARLDVDGMDG
jgi:hypothetical protein